jgi:uncharacterized protein YhaN
VIDNPIAQRQADIEAGFVELAEIVQSFDKQPPTIRGVLTYLERAEAKCSELSKHFKALRETFLGTSLG